MRKLLIVLLLSSCVFAQEIKRPTTDTDSGAATWAVNNCGAGTTVSSISGIYAYDAAGQATSTNFTGRGGKYSNNLSSRTFSAWQATAATYASLSLNVNVSSAGYSVQGVGSPAQACVVTSTDAGTTWASLTCDSSGAGWLQKTFTQTLSPTQDLTKLRVGMCILATGGDGILSNAGQDNLTIWDIWTTGNTGSATSGIGSKTSGQPHRGLVIVH